MMKRTRHASEQVIRKLRDADRMLAEQQSIAEIAKALGVSENTYPRWRNLQDQGWEINRKRVQRPWREEGLRVPQRTRKRRRLGDSTAPEEPLRAERPGHV